MTKQIKVQYFPADLAFKLGLGEIQEMHIDIVNDRPVLRITASEPESSEYHTVHTTKSGLPKPSRKPKAIIKDEGTQKPKTIIDRVSGAIGDGWKNKTPPDWLTRKF